MRRHDRAGTHPRWRRAQLDFGARRCDPGAPRRYWPGNPRPASRPNPRVSRPNRRTVVGRAATQLSDKSRTGDNAAWRQRRRRPSAWRRCDGCAGAKLGCQAAMACVPPAMIFAFLPYRANRSRKMMSVLGDRSASRNLYIAESVYGKRLKLERLAVFGGVADLRSFFIGGAAPQFGQVTTSLLRS